MREYSYIANAFSPKSECNTVLSLYSLQFMIPDKTTYKTRHTRCFKEKRSNEHYFLVGCLLLIKACV